MTTETLKGKMENAYGQQLPKPISFEGTVELYSSFDEISAEDKPTNDDILSFVNNRKKANARQKLMNDALKAAGIEKPTLEDNPELQVATMVKALLASGKYNREQADKIARQTLGL